MSFLHEGKKVLLVPHAPRKVDRKPGPRLQQKKNGAPLEGVFLKRVRHVGWINQRLVTHILEASETSRRHNVHARRGGLGGNNLLHKMGSPVIATGLKVFASPGPVHSGFQHTERANKVRLQRQGVGPEFHEQLSHWGRDRPMGGVRHTGQEKLPGEGWVEVKVADRGRVARGKPGSCGLSNRHEHQRTQGMTDTFRGRNCVEEELVGCKKWCLRKDGQVACGK